jgi:hypothetical protein
MIASFKIAATQPLLARCLTKLEEPPGYQDQPCRQRDDRLNQHYLLARVPHRSYYAQSNKAIRTALRPRIRLLGTWVNNPVPGGSLGAWWRACCSRRGGEHHKKKKMMMMSVMSASERDPRLERHCSLVDGVYAIAVTLLAIELVLPAPSEHLHGEALLQSILRASLTLGPRCSASSPASPS